MKGLLLALVVSLLILEVKGRVRKDDKIKSDDVNLNLDDLKAIDAEDNHQNPKTVDDIPGITKEILDEAFKKARREQDEENERFKKTDLSQESVDSHYGRVVPELEDGRKRVLQMEKMIKHVAKKLKLSVKETAEKLHNVKRLGSGEWSLAERKPCAPCVQNERYRTIDGSCNNLKQPFLGAARTAFSRLIPPDYGDGMSELRRAKSGDKLLNARRVSNIMFANKDVRSKEASSMMMSFGQFTSHDTDHACQPDIKCDRTCKHVGECIGIKANDYRMPYGHCIMMKRDVPFESKNGEINKVREQVNKKSSYLDCSQVYGDDPKTFKALRDKKYSWLLESRKHEKNKKGLLPRQKGGFCASEKKRYACMKSGDDRTNVNPGLLLLHNLWLREHNRIAKKLKKFNKDWGDNVVFFEARKIVIAITQHITYNEYLPELLDKKTLEKYGLNIKCDGDYYYGYDERTNPSVSNSFAAATFRFGHSMITEKVGDMETRDFFNPTKFYTKGADFVARGFTYDTAGEIDYNIPEAVHDYLQRFETDWSDLMSLNIQRGREHGIPGYNEFRKFCKLPVARTFQDLKKTFTDDDIYYLKKAYKHVDDIELFVGGLLEIHTEGANLGPTFSCLMGIQFQRLRKGDRFWYENPFEKTGFTKKQLREIKRGASLARLICDNGDDIKKMPPLPLKKTGDDNKRVPCSQITRGIDLTLWKEGEGKDRKNKDNKEGGRKGSYS